MTDYTLTHDGYGDLALCEDGEPILRKYDLPLACRERVWTLIVDTLEAEEVQPCAAVVWRGKAWGPNPEPDEMCERDALPGAEYCEYHLDPEDCR